MLARYLVNWSLESSGRLVSPHMILAHLSREVILYPWSVVVVVANNSKHVLLLNRLANQSQILCGAPLERGIESLYKWSRSHDQDDHAHIW